MSNNRNPANPTDDEEDDKEIKINKLYTQLQEILNANDFDLDSLRQNDIEFDEIGEFCNHMKFNIIQKAKFRQLMRLIDDTNVDHVEVEQEQKQDDKLKRFLQKNNLQQLYHILIKQSISYQVLQNMAPKHIEDICEKNNIDIGTTIKLRQAINKHQQRVLKKKAVKFDHKMNVVLIGNSGVGKTCLLHRFVTNGYKESMLRTYGVDDGSVHYLELHDGSVMKMKIWDTSGQERYHSICSRYYRTGDVILYCYDTSDRSSLDNCLEWLAKIEQHAKENVFIEVVGCKCDAVYAENNECKRVEGKILSEKGQESDAIKADVEGKILNAKEWGNYKIEHVECSAKTGQNVNNVFVTAAEMALMVTSTDIGEDHGADGVDLNDENAEKPKSGCPC